jgi:hypothetical protein
MHSPSAAEIARQSEGHGQTLALGEIARLDRRRFLRGSAFTVAGLATLSGVELVRSPLALAQQPTTALSPVSNMQLTSASATSVPGHPTLQVCRHAFQLDYAAGPNDPPGVPPDLVRTYRLNEGNAYPASVLNGPPADRLNPLLQPAPFQSGAVPADPFPTPSVNAPTTVPAAPESLLPLACYRLVTQIGQNSFRLFDWCTFFCFPENFIVITAGDKCLCYRVGSVAQTPPPPQKNVVSDTPQLTDFWGAIRSGTPHSVGGIYYYTYNSQQGSFSTATWNATLDVAQGSQCRVDAFIPGSSQPQNRTAQAKYEITNSGVVGRNMVTISQQLATSQWVTLGVFPFRAGTFSVRLVDETGEPTGSRIVVADAVRWVGV